MNIEVKLEFYAAESLATIKLEARAKRSFKGVKFRASGLSFRGPLQGSGFRTWVFKKC